MILDGNAVKIAIQGPDNTLMYYSATIGTGTWSFEIVAGAGTTGFTPSMILNGNAVNITAEGLGASSTTTGWSTAPAPGTPRRSLA